MDKKLNKQPKNSESLTHLENNDLLVDYAFESDDALFDVCDLSGSILISGKLADTKSVDVSCLPKGVYVFYIIDCGRVLKEKIQI